MDADLAEHVQRNRTAWDTWAARYAEYAPRAWARDEPIWGQTQVPDAELGILPHAVQGMDVIELGCGTAYFSAWLAKLGAKPVGIDNSPKQLETARRMQAEFGIDFPLHLGNAEDLPFPDASFDLAISEYGASIWCDPYKWIPEAARVLRPGGRLVFLVNSLLTILCSGLNDAEDTPVSTCLQRPLFGLHRVEWPDDDSVEFHLPHGEWIRVLRTNGFEIEQLFEPEPQTARDIASPPISANWARQWPAEEIWCARKRN